MAGSCEHGNKTSGPMTAGKFLDYQNLNKCSAVYSKFKFNTRV